MHKEGFEIYNDLIKRSIRLRVIETACISHAVITTYTTN